MNLIVNCPGCGFRGQLPGDLTGLRSIVCPNCKTSVPVDELRKLAAPVPDDSFPIWVDGGMGRVPEVVVAPPAKAEDASYNGDYMKDEAARFAQYVAARLAELHKRRTELAEAESRFETVTMQRKQELHRYQGAQTASADDLARREAEVKAKEASIAPREAELASREARVARSELRAADLDRRAAELRSTLDNIEARRTALAEERVALDRRTAELDRAEVALHRRTAELDEMDERLRLEQEEWEQAHDRARIL